MFFRIGVPKIHRIVILSAEDAASGLRQWLLPKAFFPNRSLMWGLIPRRARQSEFSEEPKLDEVGALLGRLANVPAVQSVQKVGVIGGVVFSGVYLVRHYYQVDDLGFWTAPVVVSHRMEYVRPPGATTITLVGEHASYRLGAVGRQVADVLSDDGRTRRAA